MKILIVALILIALGIALSYHSGLLEPTKYGDKLTPKKPTVQVQEEKPEPKVDHKLEHPDSKDEPKTTIFYTFENRVVPASAGTIDLTTNSVSKEVPVSAVAGYTDYYHRLDVQPERRRIRIQIVEIVASHEDGFSLPTLVSSLVTTLTSVQSSTTTTTVVASSAPTSIIPQALATEILPALSQLLQQAKPDSHVNIKLSTVVWLTSGVEQKFSDFTEQTQTTVVTTQTSTTASPSQRTVGLTFSLKPFISKTVTTIQYQLSNTEPQTDITQTGQTLDGETVLAERPIVLLDSSRVQTIHSSSRLLGIPVAFGNTHLDKMDMILIEPFSSEQLPRDNSHGAKAAKVNKTTTHTERSKI